MENKDENEDEKAEVAKVIYEMWRHENDIVNQKTAIYFTALSILLVALPNAPLITSIVGLGISIIWLISIGRTVAFRVHWKGKIENLLKNSSDLIQRRYSLFPTREEEKKMPWYGRVPSTLVLLGTPLLGAIFWVINLIANLK